MINKVLQTKSCFRDASENKCEICGFLFVYLPLKVYFILMSHLEYLVLSSGLICDMLNTELNGGLWLDGL